VKSGTPTTGLPVPDTSELGVHKLRGLSSGGTRTAKKSREGQNAMDKNKRRVEGEKKRAGELGGKKKQRPPKKGEGW